MNRAFLLIAALLCVASNVQAQLSPEETLKKFTVADGLQVELFAAEPMLINPTSIDIDEKGRVWVCEAVNYRVVKSGKPLYRPEGDRIVILEDTDGDGKADKSHVFYQAKDFVAPLGIAIAPIPPSPQRKHGGYRVYVCYHSDIVIFEDKDGDLKADGPPTKLLGGFGGFDTDHGLHGINIGPDGKLYFTVGDAGVKNVQSSDGKGPKWNSNQTDCRAGTVWRCDLDGKNLELIAHNFRNHYDCCVNSFGEIWTSDNDDDGSQQTRLCYVMPGGNYGYHPRGPGQSHWHEEQPGIVPKVLRTGFGSPSGICFYEGTLLPKKYHGQILHCDAGPREFRCFHLTPKGAGYEAEKEVLVTSSDNWFRLSDCCVAPDGSVMIADWYDPGVGGNGMGDTTRGRIYRVTPKRHKGYKVAAVKLETKNELLSNLASPTLATRSLSMAHISQLKFNEASSAFNATMIAGDKNLRALGYWQMARYSQQVNDETLRCSAAKPLSMKGDNFRAQGVRLADEFLRGTTFSLGFNVEFLDLTPEVYTIVVWREMLIASRNYPSDKVGTFIFEAAKKYDGQDRFYLAALNIACGTDPARRDAILADFDKHFPEWNDKVADLVWELRPKSMLPKMEKMLSDAKLTGPQKARIVDILAASDDVAIAKVLLNLLTGDHPAEVKARAIDNLKLFLPTKWNSLAKSNGLKKIIDTLLQDAKSKAIGLQLAAAANYIDAIDTIDKSFGLDPPAVQIEAIRALGKLNDPKAVEVLVAIVALLREQATMRSEAIQALGEHLSGRGDSPAARKALDALKELVSAVKWPTEARVSALSALAGSRSGTGWLLQLREQNKMPEDLIVDAGKLLRNSPFQAERNKALALFPTPNKLDLKKLPPLAELAKRIGDVERGREIWAASFRGETQCAKCHIVNGKGGQIGPDLSAIGKKASKENLFESIVQPSKAIADQFLQWKIETTNGQTILGLIVEETPAAITIRDANGKDTKIVKSEIDSRTKSPISIMPEDIVKFLTEDDLVDLAAYLLTLKAELPTELRIAPQRP